MTLRELEMVLDHRENTMGEMAEDYTDSGLEALSLHQQGRCGELGGPCPYCLEEGADDESEEWSDE